jgi:hypothetical protein
LLPLPLPLEDAKDAVDTLRCETLVATLRLLGELCLLSHGNRCRWNCAEDASLTDTFTVHAFNVYG